MNGESEVARRLDDANKIERNTPPGYPAEIKKITKQADPDLWLQMGLLRAKSYVDEHQFLTTEDLDENGAEYDIYDEDASHFVVTDTTGSVIATSRLIYRRDKDGLLLPSEELFDLPNTDSAREVSRLIVDKKLLASEVRKYSGALSLYLIRAMTQESIEHPEAGPLYAVVEPFLQRYLAAVGITHEVAVSEPSSDKYNSENILIEFLPEAVTRGVHEVDSSKSNGSGALAPFMEGRKSTFGVGKIDLVADFNALPQSQYDRNLGWMNRAEHEKLQNSTVAIAGVGGDGGALAVQLARMGVSSFRLADPEMFESDNINRQEGADYSTIGRNKAEVIAEQIRAIQPFADIVTYKDGVTVDNIEEFVAGTDLVVDETEFTKHEIGVMIARESRKNNIPVLMALNVGFGSYVTSFSPQGMSFEKYLGLSETAPLEEVATQKVSLSKWVPHIPSYADMSTFKKVAEGEVPTPTVVPGVGVAASHATVQALAHLLGDLSPERQKWIRFAPRGQSIDIIDGHREVRFPTVHFATSALKAYIRTRLGKNPTAGS